MMRGADPGGSSDLKEEVENALSHFSITRIVQSLRISSFENVSERFTLTYINQDTRPHDVLPLPPMPRTTQRSLKVFDESGSELPVIPSYEIHEAFKELSKGYLRTILSKIDMGDNNEIEGLESALERVFRYGDVEEDIEVTRNILDSVSKHIINLESDSRTLCENLLTKLKYLIVYQRHYIPFIDLRIPFPQGKHQIVYYTTERPYTLGKDQSFYMRGSLEHFFYLKPSLALSYHLELIPPEGTEIHDFEFKDWKMAEKKEREKHSFFDKGLFYFSFSPDETKELYEKIRSGGRPVLILRMRVNFLLRALYLLVRTVVLLPLLVKVLTGLVGLTGFISFLALGATIFVSASLHAIDRKIVQEFALYQLLIILVFLFVETITLLFSKGTMTVILAIIMLIFVEIYIENVPREIIAILRRWKLHLPSICVYECVLILQYLHPHGDTRYTELQSLTGTYTLTMRLRTLRTLGLVEHHIDKEQRRREWYTITEKGKKMLTILKDILSIFEE